ARDKGSCDAAVICIKKVPYIITEPGVYALAHNLTISGCNVGITIATNDVVLDLHGFSLLGGYQAIAVNADLNDIMIQNGTVGDTQADGIIVAGGCSDVQILDMNVVNCNYAQCNGQAGIFFD